MTSPTPPPCFRPGQPPNPCQSERWRRIVENKTPLHGAWVGWRMAGRDLVAPNGVRFRPDRFLSIAWAEKRAEIKERKQAKVQKRPCNVVKLPARERFDGQA